MGNTSNQPGYRPAVGNPGAFDNTIKRMCWDECGYRQGFSFSTQTCCPLTLRRHWPMLTSESRKLLIKHGTVNMMTDLRLYLRFLGEEGFRVREEWDLRDAEDLYREATENDSDTALLDLADLLIEKGDLGHAEELLLAALDKGDTVALGTLGRIAYRRGDQASAEKWWLRASEETSPEEHIPIALWRLQRLYFLQGLASQAEKYEELALEEGMFHLLVKASCEAVADGDSGAFNYLIDSNEWDSIDDYYDFQDTCKEAIGYGHLEAREVAVNFLYDRLLSLNGAELGLDVEIVDLRSLHLLSEKGNKKAMVLEAYQLEDEIRGLNLKIGKAQKKNKEIKSEWLERQAALEGKKHRLLMAAAQQGAAIAIGLLWRLQPDRASTWRRLAIDTCEDFELFRLAETLALSGLDKGETEAKNLLEHAARKGFVPPYQILDETVETSHVNIAPDRKNEAESETLPLALHYYLEFRGDDASLKSGHSEKFWELTADGRVVTVRFGKLGASGQSVVKEFATPSLAIEYSEKARREKERKGYVTPG